VTSSSAENKTDGKKEILRSVSTISNDDDGMNEIIEESYRQEMKETKQEEKKKST